jgi:hypothetical protein
VATAETVAAAPAKRGRLARAFAAVSTGRALFATLLALVSGGVALLFQLRPDLLPDPRSHLGATSAVFAVDSDVTLKTFLHRRAAFVSPQQLVSERQQYLAQTGAQPKDAAAVLTLPGEDVFVRLNVEGFKSRSIGMLASMYDAKTGRRLRELDEVRVFSETLSSPSDRSVIEFWLPAPPVTTRTYFVRVEVFHRGDGVLLAIADSAHIHAS